MRAIVIPILILVLLVQSFAKWIIVLEWKWNQSFIAKELCINKAKPRLKCNGKCQLAKSIAQEEENNSKSSSPKSQHTILLYAEDTSEITVAAPVQFHLVHNGIYKQTAYPSPCFPIFHPPAV